MLTQTKNKTVAPQATASATPVRATRSESLDSVLAKNLTAARDVSGFTQHELAAAAGISRATIAQLETGSSDPRLSTLIDLAKALNISPLLLLVGEAEVAAIAHLLKGSEVTSKPAVRPNDLDRMRHYVKSGLLKDRLRAARLGAAIAREAGPNSTAVVAAGVLGAISPEDGTILGISIGELLSRC